MLELQNKNMKTAVTTGAHKIVSTDLQNQNIPEGMNFALAALGRNAWHSKTVLATELGKDIGLETRLKRLAISQGTFVWLRTAMQKNLRCNLQRAANKCLQADLFTDGRIFLLHVFLVLRFLTE